MLASVIGDCQFANPKLSLALQQSSLNFYHPHLSNCKSLASAFIVLHLVCHCFQSNNLQVLFIFIFKSFLS